MFDDATIAAISCRLETTIERGTVPSYIDEFIASMPKLFLLLSSQFLNVECTIVKTS